MADKNKSDKGKPIDWTGWSGDKDRMSISDLPTEEKSRLQRRDIMVDPKIWSAMVELAGRLNKDVDMYLSELIQNELRRVGVTWWEDRNSKVMRGILEE